MSIFEIVGIGVGLYASFYLIKAIKNIFEINKQLKEITKDLQFNEKK